MFWREQVYRGLITLKWWFRFVWFLLFLSNLANSSFSVCHIGVFCALCRLFLSKFIFNMNQNKKKSNVLLVVICVKYRKTSMINTYMEHYDCELLSLTNIHMQFKFWFLSNACRIAATAFVLYSHLNFSHIFDSIDFCYFTIHFQSVWLL